MHKYYIALSIVLPILISCSKLSDETVSALNELKQTSMKEKEYEAAFCNEVESIRNIIQNAGTDSLKWENTYRLSMKFLHFDIDSATLYSVKKLSLHRTKEQAVLDEIQRLHYICYRGLHSLAIEDFRKIDTTGMGSRIQYRYLIADIGFHKHFGEYESYLYDVVRIINLYPKSNYGIRMKGELLVQNGQYADAIDYALAHIHSRDKNLCANLYEILSDAYGAMGDRDRQYYWLAESVSMHLRLCDRWHYSIHKLSSLYLADKDYENAYYYIDRMGVDCQKGHYYNAMQASNESKDVLNEILGESEKQRRISFEIAVFLLALLLVMSVFIALKAVKFARTLHRLNSQLTLRNEELFQANRIRDTYLFRHMLLSSEYIGKLAENRSRIKKILKKEGVESVVAYLKEPNYDTEEYRLFFKEFDQAFINLFPDFVRNVNRLLKEGAQIPEESFKSPLSMELRILSLLKLGMKSSSDISVFLNCALSSVYSVRSRIAANSIYNKKEFEEKVGNC